MSTAEDPALFPMSPEERVAKVRLRLEAALEKAAKAAEKAAEKEARALADLDEFDAAIDAVKRGE